MPDAGGPRLLVTGASGRLGTWLLRHLRHPGVHVMAWSGSATGAREGFDLVPVDLGSPGAILTALDRAAPDVIVHAAAVSSLAECVKDPARATWVNVGSTRQLAEWAARVGARLVFLSTDLVFGGEHAPYAEPDLPGPASHYGLTKVAAEEVVTAVPGSLVLRLANLSGPSISGSPSWFDQVATSLRAGAPVTLFEDEWRTPLDYDSAAGAVLAAASSDVTGLLHLGGPERLTRLEMGLIAAEVLGLDPSPVVRARRAEVPAPEPRPRDVSLDSSRWRALFPGLPWPGYRAACRALVSDAR